MPDLPPRPDDDRGPAPDGGAEARRIVAAVDAERARIGQDLHDSVGQLLTAVRLLGEGLAAQPGLDGPSCETARRIAALASDALAEVRQVSRGVAAPPALEGGVEAALAALAARVDALGAVRCVFETPGGVVVADPDAALQVYRVVQEATTNALRHAGATAIRVVLGRDAGRVVVEVHDDGAGGAVPGGRPGTLGLDGMARRARSVGAGLTVRDRDGGGTTVRMELAVEGGAAARGDDESAG